VNITTFAKPETVSGNITDPKIDIFKIMKAYISVSYSKRKLVDKEINAIVETLSDFKISSFIFVDNYKFDLTQERQMMEQAMVDIDNCDILIAETSDKGIGIGIEVGYAKAKEKIIIYLRQRDKEHSTTVSGISDFQIIYNETIDLKAQLADTLEKIENSI
jgi:2'-deoxynucleoside 5'-phosphate N-hydrolase